ncbi:MAG: hypothetical protein FWD71_20290 [Oscillospiraceae bacterium]|nr:hypothetical protein [Oscillospiraceae bacterium]
MKQRIYSAICGIVLLFMFSLTGITVHAAAPMPTNVERKTVSGVEYIVKTFDVNTSITADMLVENDFESDGYKFAYTKTDRKENVSELSKQAAKTATLDSATNSAATILKQFTPNMSYSEDGYFGTLTLDTASLVTQPSGYGARNVPIYKTREYKGLLYNDPSYVSQSITDSGVTLSLTNIEWVVTATALAGDSLVPTEYKAVAQYSGSQRVTYVTGYTSTVQYTGVVTKRAVDSVTYIITYTGTLIPVPTTTEPPTTTAVPTTTVEITTTAEPTSEDTTASQHGSNATGFIFPIVLILSLAALAVTGFILYKKIISRNKKAGISIYNLIDEKYILLGTVPLDTPSFVIDLNQFDASIKSANFGFVLDKHSAEALNGNNIIAKYNGETLSHAVQKNEKSGEYKFYLIFGKDFE